MTVIFRASSEAGNAERLARKSPCDEINPSEEPAIEVSDVGYKDGWAVMSFKLEQPPICLALSSASWLLGAIASIALGVGQNAPEVFDELPLAVGFGFAEGDRPEACPLGRKGKPSDSAEEIDVGGFIHVISILIILF